MFRLSCRSRLSRFRLLLSSLFCLSLVLTLSACATQKQSRVVGAATAPLSDLNLVQVEIPDVLLIAKQQPYALPADAGCDSLNQFILELDAVLGPDLDTDALKTKPGLVERSTTEAGDAAVGALRRTTESVLPFRSWIRKLTGAERRSKETAAAIAAGIVRRAFLKGLGAASGCKWCPPVQPEAEASH
jgi:hypothetical protein